VSNTVIYLLDADYRPVKNGEIGEIFASGLNLAAGYVNGRDPERFLENPLAVEKSRFFYLHKYLLRVIAIQKRRHTRINLIFA